MVSRTHNHRLVAVAAIVVAAAALIAEPRAALSQDARELFKQGVALYQNGAYDEAAMARVAISSR